MQEMTQQEVIPIRRIGLVSRPRLQVGFNLLTSLLAVPIRLRSPRTLHAPHPSPYAPRRHLLSKYSRVSSSPEL